MTCKLLIHWYVPNVPCTYHARSKTAAQIGRPNRVKHAENRRARRRAGIAPIDAPSKDVDEVKFFDDVIECSEVHSIARRAQLALMNQLLLINIQSNLENGAHLRQESYIVSKAS